MSAMAQLEKHLVSESIEALSSKLCREVLQRLQNHEQNFPALLQMLKPSLSEMLPVDQKRFVKDTLTKLEEAKLVHSFAKEGNFGAEEDQWYEMTPLVNKIVEGILQAFKEPNLSSKK